MTAIVPSQHQPGAAPGSEPAGPAPRSLMPISVNLLPDEVIRARAGASARRVTVIALLVVAALMGAWYFQARQAASSAQDSLDQATKQTAIAKHAQLKYTGVTNTKNEIDGLQTKLKAATSGDVAWAALVAKIRAQLRDGLSLTGITTQASVSQQTSTTGSNPGSVTLTGTARNEAGVHEFADRLAALPELSNTFVTSVAAQSGKTSVTFSISLVVGKSALNTRYAKAGTK